MSTIAVACKSELGDNICQGDVFKNVRYAYINDETNSGVQIVEYTFPMAVIISQGCDVLSMGEMEIDRQGKATKFMPSILMSPIYDEKNAKLTTHLDNVFQELELSKLDSSKETMYSSKEYDVVRKDWHYRYHALEVVMGKKTILEGAIIDFKHYFTVPASYLIKNRENRVFRLDDIYAEQVTLKFATFLSRVAMPDNSAG